MIIAGAGIAGLSLAIRLSQLALPVLVIEARSEHSLATEGAFLTLAPNGMNGLRALGCYEAVLASGIETTGIELCNARGKSLGWIDQSDHAEAFGAPIVTLGRGVLAAHLLDCARTAGVEVQLGQKVVGLHNGAEKIEVVLSDGRRIEGDLVAAGDGLRSRVRALACPEFPAPRYTGLIGTGGIVDAPVPATGGTMRMTFGNNAFFGYIKRGDEPVYWFNSYSAAEEEVGRIGDPAAYARMVESLHAGDPSENLTILRSVASIDRNYPIYDLPELPAWSRGRVVLIGDAAHAVGPHAGQGASMAVEDALVLAACIADGNVPSNALSRFEALRRKRLALVAGVTRQNSSRKQAKGPIALFMRDLLLPLFIPLAARQGRKLLADRVDLDPLRLHP